jgi:gliding motility-associated-like protein
MGTKTKAADRIRCLCFLNNLTILAILLLSISRITVQYLRKFPMKKTLLSLFVFCFLVVSQAKASHIAGGDLSYVCLGNNQYQINLNLFVDCLGFDPGNIQTINFNSPCGSTTTSVNALNPGGTEISQLCPTQINNSTCNGGSLPGMWVFHYTGTVTLAPCNSWTMSWEVCCRNNAVLNLTNASSFGSYIAANLNNATNACDNSPSFNAQPIPYVCQGQVVNYSYGVTETDGDSLYYSLINAMDAGGTLLTYSSGYSASSPIPGITINAFTGMLTFTPSTLGNFVVVVLVEEYDSNGNLIGTVMRDIQFVVQSCSNSVPDPAAGAITNMTGTAVQTGPYSIELCEGSDFTFNASYTDQNAADALTLISNIATVLPGSTLTTSGTNPIVATISWIAPIGSANSNTTFSVTIDDGSCPVPGQQTFVYDVQVLPRTATGPDQVICGPQSATLTATGGSIFNWTVISGHPMVVGTNFSCNPCNNPVATPDTTTTYEVTSNLSGTCINKDTITITVVPDYSFTATQSDSITCLGSTVELDVSVNPAGNYTYLWSPSSNLNNTGIADPVATYSVPGTYNYDLQVTSPLGCVKHDTISVIVAAAYPPNATLSYTSSPCVGDSIQLQSVFGDPIPTTCGVTSTLCAGTVAATIGVQTGSNTSTTWPAIFGNWYTSEKHQMLFRASELLAAGITAGKIDQIDIPVTAINGITAYHQFTIKMGCTSLNALGSTWESGLFQVFGPATVNIVVGANTCTFTNAFEWDGVSNIIVEICSTEGPGPGSYSNYTNSSISPYSSTPFVSCLYSYTDQNDMCPDQQNFISAVTDRPIITFHYCGAVDISNYTYSWLPVPLLSDPASQNTGAYLPSSTTYTLYVTDTLTGCSDTTALSVTAFPPTAFTLSVGNDVTICPGASATLSASGATTYSWSPAGGLSNPTSSNPIASPTTTTTYTVTAMTPCAPTAIDSITVSAVNSVILNVNAGPDVTTCPGVPVTLNATGATSYTWNTSNTLSSTTIANPVATLPVVGSVTYTVVGTANCANPVSDVVTVTAVNSVILNVNAGNDTVVCPGVPTQLTATGATQYIWSPAASLSNANVASPLANPSVTTTYTVIGTAACADPVTDSVTVSTTSSTGPLLVNAGVGQSICVGEELNLSGSSSGGYGNNNYLWSVVSGAFNDSATSPATLSTPIITDFPGLNIYELQVRDQCGYISSDTIMIDISADCMVIVPNVFTPNGDGNNDEFLVSSNGVKSFSIAIYNRWGKKLYESSDIKSGWNGGNSPDGTYFYIMKAETLNGKTFDQQGYFQLLGK